MAKIVFMGTPEFAVPSLKGLLCANDVAGGGDSAGPPGRAQESCAAVAG